MEPEDLGDGSSLDVAEVSFKVVSVGCLVCLSIRFVSGSGGGE